MSDWFDAVIGILIFLLATPLVPRLVPQNSQPFAFALAVKLAELGYFFSALYFVLRVVRVLRVWLTDSAGQRSSPMPRAVIPLFGAAIYYNLLHSQLKSRWPRLSGGFKSRSLNR